MNNKKKWRKTTEARKIRAGKKEERDFWIAGMMNTAKRQWL